MAAVIKSIQSNIIKMIEVDLRERQLEFSVWVNSYRNETQCVGNVHNVSSTRVTEFDFLKENLDSGR